MCVFTTKRELINKYLADIIIIFCRATGDKSMTLICRLAVESCHNDMLYVLSYSSVLITDSKLNNK